MHRLTALPQIPGRFMVPLGPATELIGVMTRVVFSSTLLLYFWSSAMTKLDGFALSMNAYAQILPRHIEAVGYDASQLGVLSHLIVGVGTSAEFVLPLLVGAGFLTRLASLGMIGFVVVMTLTDLYGHGVGGEVIGRPFDRFPDAPIADQRLMWVWMLAVLSLTGGGYLSLDRLARKLRPR